MVATKTFLKKYDRSYSYKKINRMKFWLTMCFVILFLSRAMLVQLQIHFIYFSSLKYFIISKLVMSTDAQNVRFKRHVRSKEILII